MSSEKADLARAGTMQVTAKEGKNFLKKNLTEWKKPYLLEEEETEESNEAGEEEPGPSKKAKLSKHTTIKATTKEGKELLGSEKLGDTRGETKAKKAAKGSVARATTIDKVTAEAKLIYGDLPKSEGRSLRKRAAPAPVKAPTKKKAKEGKPVKNSRKQKKAAAKVVDAEEGSSGEADESAE